MSRQVTLSDTFYPSLEAHLQALVNYAVDPSRENFDAFQMLPHMYEYDTLFWVKLNAAFDYLVERRPPR